MSNRRRSAGKNLPARAEPKDTFTAQRHEMAIFQFQGPMPPPEMLREYDALVPGFAATLLGEFTAQGGHRRELEKKVIGRGLSAQTTGQWLGAILFLAVVVAAVILGLDGHDTVAIALVGIDVLGFGSVYAWGRVQQSRERAG